MIYSLLNKLDQFKAAPLASAHCDVPCGIYDPSTAQISALSVIRFLDQIADLGDGELTRAQQATLVRLVAEKEAHVAKVKEEVRIIWGDYIKAPQKEQFPQIDELVHNIMLAGSAAKQHIDRANGETLLKLVNEFAEIFWATKGVDTYTATCPYAPNEDVVYPDLKK
ncbi:MAG: superoxide dismutase, Ni [Gammaproteobacteria bacterium]|nr:MAG: superoxide dismutase, Ni [Gammaproteobacteria bacterium]